MHYTPGLIFFLVSRLCNGAYSHSQTPVNLGLYKRCNNGDDFENTKGRLIFSTYFLALPEHKRYEQHKADDNDLCWSSSR